LLSAGKSMVCVLVSTSATKCLCAAGTVSICSYRNTCREACGK
jgi:hypothetical protein